MFPLRSGLGGGVGKGSVEVRVRVRVGLMVAAGGQGLGRRLGLGLRFSYLLLVLLVLLVQIVLLVHLLAPQQRLRVRRRLRRLLLRLYGASIRHLDAARVRGGGRRVWRSGAQDPSWWKYHALDNLDSFHSVSLTRHCGKFRSLSEKHAEIGSVCE